MDLNEIERKVSQSGGELTELTAAVKALSANKSAVAPAHHLDEVMRGLMV
jgi:hypothetical protein